MMVSAVFQQSQVNFPTVLLKDYVSQSTEHYRFDFRLFGLLGLLCAGMFSNWLSQSSTHSVMTMLTG